MRARLVALALAALAACHGRSKQAPAPLVIDVIAGSSGASASEVESSIARPIEEALAALPAVVGLHTTCTDDGASIAVSFDAADVDAIAAVSRAVPLRQLPELAQPPAVVVEPGEIALRYSLFSATLPPVYVTELHDRIVVPALQRQRGVGKIATCGAQGRARRVTVDPAAAAALGLAISDVRAALAAAPNGGADVIRELVVATRNGAPVRMVDLASVTDATIEPSCYAFSARGTVLEGIVRVQAGADVERVRDATQKALAAASADLPAAIEVAPITAAGSIAVVLAPGLDVRARLDAARHALAASDDLFGLVELRDDIAHVLVTNATPELAARIAHDLPGTRAAVDDDTARWLRVLGPDLDELARASDALVAAIARVPGAVVIARDGGERVERHRFEVDRDLAARLDVDIRAVDEAIAARTSGLRVAGSNGLVTDLHMTDAPLDRAFVRTRSGAQVPLSELVHERIEPAPRAIVRIDRQRAAGIRVHAPDDARAAVHDAIARVPLPAGYTLRSEL